MSSLENPVPSQGGLLRLAARGPSQGESLVAPSEISPAPRRRGSPLTCREVTVEAGPPIWKTGVSRSSHAGRSAGRAETFEVIFSREASVADFLESLLLETEISIEAALHQLSNPRLVYALLEASHRGVHVRLLLDRTKFEEAVSAFPALSNGGLSVRLLNGRLGPASRMHHKFALLDHRTAVTGSYNWTVGSDEQNFENLVVLRGPKEAAAFRREFNTLWGLGTAAPQRAKSEESRGSREDKTALDAARSGDATKQEKGYRIYLMRRGRTEARGQARAGSNLTEPLTAEGRKRVSEIAAGLVEAGFEVNGIVTSPSRATLETAKIVAARLQPDMPIETCEALLPGGAADDAIRFIRQRPELRRVLVVGHEPGLSRLAARLLDSSEDANLKLKKGGCCLLAFDELPAKGNGRLVWWLPPRLLRRLR